MRSAGGSIAISHVRPAGAAILGVVSRITGAAILEAVAISRVRSMGAAILGVISRIMGAAILGAVHHIAGFDSALGRVGPVEASPARLVDDGHSGKRPHH